MQFIIKSIAALLVILYFSGCLNPPDYPTEPVIKYESVNKASVYQGIADNPTDTLIVSFSFTDGDGDLSQEGLVDLQLYDSRTPDFPTPYSLPVIPVEGTGNGLSGEVFIAIPNKPSAICCINYITGTVCQKSLDQPIDTFSFAITMQDRAGNVSNKIQTEQITIICY